MPNFQISPMPQERKLNIPSLVPDKTNPNNCKFRFSYPAPNGGQGHLTVCVPLNGDLTSAQKLATLKAKVILDAMDDAQKIKQDKPNEYGAGFETRKIHRRKFEGDLPTYKSAKNSVLEGLKFYQPPIRTLCFKDETCNYGDWALNYVHHMPKLKSARKLITSSGDLIKRLNSIQEIED